MYNYQPSGLPGFTTNTDYTVKQYTYTSNTPGLDNFKTDFTTNFGGKDNFGTGLGGKDNFGIGLGGKDNFGTGIGGSF